MKHLHLALAPAVKLMLRLKYPYKFALIGLLAIGEILFLFYPMARHLQSGIDIAQRELSGLAVDQSLLSLIQLVQQERHLSAAVMSGAYQRQAERETKQKQVQAAISKVELAIATHGKELGITANWQSAKTAWDSLRDSGLKLSPDANREAHTALIQQLLMLINKIGDSSFLVLDPQADSYYLIDAVTGNLPGTLELVGQLRVHGTLALTAKAIDDGGRAGFAGEVAVLRSKRDALNVSIKKIASTNPAIAARLADFSSQFQQATDEILQIVRDDIVGARFATHPDLYLEKTTAAIDLGFQQAHVLLLPLLNDLLQTRIGQMQAQYAREAAMATGFMLLFIYLAAGAYLAVMSSIQTLQQGAKRMAQGDLGTPIVLETRDELLMVADSFNSMAQQLSQRTDQLHQTGANLSQILADYEKDHPLAALASVIPAIAHDLNTPLGNTNLAASYLREKITEFHAKELSGNLHRSDLSDFIKGMDEGVDIIEKSGQRATDLATKLKQFSIDQASERRRSFELDKLLDEVLTTLAPTIRKAPWHIARKIPDGLTLDSYPGPLGQVLLNLIQNAAVHAFEGRSDGLLVLEAWPLADQRIGLSVTDNGCGMAPEITAKIFAPFFTTKLGKGGSGVGLTYALRLVKDTLGGTLEVESELGKGTTFTLILPCVAPQLASATTTP